MFSLRYVLIFLMLFLLVGCLPEPEEEGSSSEEPAMAETTGENLLPLTLGEILPAQEIQGSTRQGYRVETEKAGEYTTFVLFQDIEHPGLQIEHVMNTSTGGQYKSSCQVVPSQGNCWLGIYGESAQVTFHLTNNTSTAQKFSLLTLPDEKVFPRALQESFLEILGEKPRFYSITTGEETQNYSFSFTEKTSSLKWSLFDPEKTEPENLLQTGKYSSTDQIEVSAILLQAEKTYWLKVEQEASFGSFRMSVEPGVSSKVFETWNDSSLANSLDGHPLDYLLEGTLNQRVQVRLSELTGDVDLLVYADEQLKTPLCISQKDATTDEACEVISKQGSLYFRLRNADPEGVTEYRLKVLAENLGGEEGTIEFPIGLSGKLPYSGASNLADGFYQIPVTFGKSYTIGLSWPSSNMDLEIYGDAEFSTLLCDSKRAGKFEEFCLAEPMGSSLFVKVINVEENEGVSFTLKLYEKEEIPYQDEGSKFSPKTLAKLLPYAGQVGTGSSYYSIPVREKTTYTLVLAESQMDLSFHVYVDSGFSSLLCETTGGKEKEGRCEFTSTTEQAFVRVLGTTEEKGSSFQLQLEGNFQSEGRVEGPVELTMEVERFGEVDHGNSYYQVSVSGKESVRVTLRGLTDDLDLWVYSDANFKNLLCSSLWFGTIDETCLAEVSGELIYILVEGRHSVAGSGFRIKVRNEE